MTTENKSMIDSVLFAALDSILSKTPDPTQIEKIEDKNVQEIMLNRYMDILAYKIHVGLFFFHLYPDELKENNPDLYEFCEETNEYFRTKPKNLRPPWYGELIEKTLKWK